MANARVCVLTAPGRGAIAVLRVWGIDAMAVVESALRCRRSERFSQTESGRPRLGRLGAGIGDEVVALIHRDGATPEVEIHSHGGAEAVRAVIDDLVQHGATAATSSSWLARSRSRLQTEAHEDLGVAPTIRVAEILMRQCEGALDAELAELRDMVDREPARALGRLETLIELGSFGCRMVEGWRVVLFGRPNVGKSSLLNAIAGHARAIVSPEAGTTRDVVSLRCAIAGWPVEVSDTAGLRAPIGHIEAEGLELAALYRSDADLQVLVIDGSQPWNLDERAWANGAGNCLVVANKSDLTRAAKFERHDQAIWVSALTGDGLEELERRIADRLVPANLPIERGVPFRSAHVAILADAKRALEQGRGNEARAALDAMANW